jgi:hypothetical protein
MKKILIVYLISTSALALFFLISSFKTRLPKDIVLKEKTSLPTMSKEVYECMTPRWGNELYESEALVPLWISVTHITPNLTDKLLLNTNHLDSILIDSLNSYFKEVGFLFKLKNTSVSISNELIQGYVEHADNYITENSINVIIYHQRSENEPINGIALRSPGNQMAVNLNCLLNFKTTAHEMGHCFGLPHLFEKDDTNGKNVKFGDQICDTPSFSLMDNSYVRDCKWVGNSQYTEEDLRKIIPNFMSYNSNLKECRETFTAGQIMAMRWGVLNTPTLTHAIIIN